MSKVYKAKVPQASTKAAGSYTESAGTVVPAHVPDLKLPPDLSPVKISESPNTLSAVESSSSGPAPSDELNHPPTPSQVMGKNLTKPASPNLANLIQRSAQLEELGTPSTHISGAPFTRNSNLFAKPDLSKNDGHAKVRASMEKTNSKSMEVEDNWWVL
ncbi:hypothetical protein Bca4012_071751 [Brassica carinata]